MKRISSAACAQLVGAALYLGGGAALAQPAPAVPDPGNTQPAPKPDAKKDEPGWRLRTALGAPAWLALDLEQRSRFEALANDFRSPAADNHRALLLRTLVHAAAKSGVLLGGIELEDARIYASDGTKLDTTLTDSFELLRAYAGVDAKGVVVPGDHVEAQAGRITLDLGSRRLVARNRYRNTINGFTGVDATWTHPGGHVARVFVAMPVTRLPSDAEGLADNAIELDEENTDALLWTAYYGATKLPAATQLEAYTVGYFERDGDVASRNRRLLTFAVRWWRKPATGKPDFDVELIPQVGKSRATTAADDTDDLIHRAWSSHLEVGISPAIDWKPRLAIQHDYATGDRDPADGKQQRFDPLFGARRFDFGPTALYGAFGRANLQSPGVKVAVTPHANVTVTATYRLFWLASRTDAWVPAGVRDATGQSGTFLGEQAELVTAWKIVPGNVNLEVGAVHLRRGRFAKTAPNAPTANPSYLYTQLSFEL